MLGNSHGNCRIVVRRFPSQGRICGLSHGFCSSRRGPPQTRKKGKLLALKIKAFSLYNLDVSFRRFGTFGERLTFSKEFLLPSAIDYPPLYLTRSYTDSQTVGSDFRDSVALDSPPRDIICHPPLSANVYLVPVVEDNREMN